MFGASPPLPQQRTNRHDHSYEKQEKEIEVNDLKQKSKENKSK